MNFLQPSIGQLVEDQPSRVKLRELGGPEALVAASRLDVVRREMPNLGLDGNKKSGFFESFFCAEKQSR
jgi:hypothetical protein